ncbi:MAG: hypothetical protein U0Y10_26980 [Spirosomataceae bacterium]
MRWISCFLVLGLLVMSSFTMPNRWVFIADKIVDFGLDRDVIVVRGNDAFTKLRLHITDASLNMMDMDVVFENGERYQVPIKYNFRQGEESRAIDLPGGMRRIKRIEFLYDTQGVLRGKARVAVWGLR